MSSENLYGFCFAALSTRDSDSLQFYPSTDVRMRNILSLVLMLSDSQDFIYFLANFRLTVKLYATHRLFFKKYDQNNLSGSKFLELPLLELNSC